MKKNVIILGTGNDGRETKAYKINLKAMIIPNLIGNIPNLIKIKQICKKYNPKYAYMNKAGCGEELISLIKNSITRSTVATAENTILTM